MKKRANAIVLVLAMVVGLVIAPIFKAEVEENRYEAYSISDWVQLQVSVIGIWEE